MDGIGLCLKVLKIIIIPFFYYLFIPLMMLAGGPMTRLFLD